MMGCGGLVVELGDDGAVWVALRWFICGIEFVFFIISFWFLDLFGFDLNIYKIFFVCLACMKICKNLVAQIFKFNINVFIFLFYKNYSKENLDMKLIPSVILGLLNVYLNLWSLIWALVLVKIWKIFLARKSIPKSGFNMYG